MQSAETAKLAAIAKDKERAQEAIKRVEELNDSFSKTAEKRLSAKFDAAEERKDQQFKELQDRLKEHVRLMLCACCFVPFCKVLYLLILIMSFPIFRVHIFFAPLIFI